MNVLDVIRQTMRRAGGRRTRLRGTELFRRITNDWHTAEKLERVLRRMEQLGLWQEAQKLALSEAAGAPLQGFNPLECIIGRSQLMSSFFLSLGAERARAVGRIVTENGRGFGTGFLISPRLLMTNNHVLESERAAARARVEFDYVRRFDGSLGYTQLFRLLPADFFITSAASDDLNLDYTIVAVEAVNSQGDRLDGRGFIPIVASGEMAVKELANIIQHAGGEPQQVALRDSQVVESLEHFIRYEADTLPGSSGSPVFNDQWQLVGLHHSGVPDEVRPGVLLLRGGGEWDTRTPLPPDEQLRRSASVNWVSNEGVRVSSIIADAQARLSGDTARRALFEEAVSEQPPQPERIGVGPQKEALQSDAAPFAPGGLLLPTQDVVTWTIPLRVTMQLGPHLHFSMSAGPVTPDPPSPSTSAQDKDTHSRQRPAETATAADALPPPP